MDVSRNSPFQTYKKEVCLPGHSMHPGPWTVCCECQTRFGGRLPVPRVEAALPYWVPLSLRPRKQHPSWMHAPGTTAGGSAVTSACCPSASSSRPPTRMSYRLAQCVCCALPSWPSSRPSRGSLWPFASFLGFEVGIFSYCQEYPQKCVTIKIFNESPPIRRRL